MRQVFNERRIIGWSRTCSTCGKTLSQEGAQYCSNPFHIVVPTGHKLINGKIVKN